MLLMASFCTSCKTGGKSPVNEENTEITPAEATEAECVQDETAGPVAPLPAELDPASITDCVFPAEFTFDDFDWEQGRLHLTAYNENLYRSADILRLKAGDTVIIDGRAIVVNTVEDQSDFFLVNFGDYEHEANFQKVDDSIYRAFGEGDHSYYTELGSFDLPLAEGFNLVDCGLNPEDPTVGFTEGQREYLRSLEDWRQGFTPLNTRVTVKDGAITEITRRWIP